jgi:hypothetical protein
LAELEKNYATENEIAALRENVLLRHLKEQDEKARLETERYHQAAEERVRKQKQADIDQLTKSFNAPTVENPTEVTRAELEDLFKKSPE